MVKTAKMQLIRELVSECLSAAAEEIFKIVERTILEYDEEFSCSKWEVDEHRRLLDVTKSDRADKPQTSVTDVTFPSVDVAAIWLEPEKVTSESTDACWTSNDRNPNFSPAKNENCEGDQETLIDNEDEEDMRKNLSLPLKNLKESKSFHCPTSLSSRTMQQHVRTHPERKSSYQCHFCEKNFCLKSDLIVHTKIHASAKPYSCQICHECFAQKSSLIVHRRQHFGEKPYECGVCGESFTQKKALRVHAEKHHTSVPITRDVEKNEAHSQGLQSNVKALPLTVAPYDKSEFDQESLQPLCLYQIQAVADIDKESSTFFVVDQIKTEPHAADGESEAYRDGRLMLPTRPDEQSDGEKEMMVRHQWSEPKHLSVKRIFDSGKSSAPKEDRTVQKPYKCPHCNKRFSLTKTLIRHVKIHTENKTYQCQFCERNFCQKSDLVNHTRTHTGERPYQCHVCHRSFAQKGNLGVHMRKHTGEKPYQCPKCKSCFSHKATLDCHTQIHR